MAKIETKIKDNGKHISLCFMSAERFNEFKNSITTVEDAITASMKIEQSVNEIIDTANENIARAHRAITTLEQMTDANVASIIANNQDAIESNQKLIDSLTPTDNEFCWWKHMQKQIDLMIGDL